MGLGSRRWSPRCPGARQGAGGRRRIRYPDTFVTRLEALALIQTLNANILSSTSATTTLERWCRDHELAAPPRITATRVQGVERPATAEQRARLGVGEHETIRHRHVQLRCGDRVLSEADNWYVPSRLTMEMNRLLDTTETPFGRAVQPLAPYRRTLDVRMLWAPLPEGWERQPRQTRRGPAPCLDRWQSPTRCSSIARCSTRETTRRSPKSTKSTNASCWRFSSRRRRLSSNGFCCINLRRVRQIFAKSSHFIHHNE